MLPRQEFGVGLDSVCHPHGLLGNHGGGLPCSEQSQAQCPQHGRAAEEIEQVASDPATAVAGAHAVYTDVWASMGQESQQESRRRDFAPYQINAALMSHAQKGAFFMHCLPAHRGEEVTDEVIDSPQSVVIQQAGNRMHVQKGILAWMLGAKA